MRRAGWVAFLLVTVWSVGGCGITVFGSGSDWPSGRAFLSTSITENGADHPLAAGTRVRLSFLDDSRFTAQAGCNTMSGDGRIDGGALVLSDLATTDMGCPNDLGTQDQWLADFLTAKPSMRLDGDLLVLSTATTTMNLTDREVADPDRPLVATAWTVDTIITGDAASNVPGSLPATLNFDGTTVKATTGCAGAAGPATLAATYTVNGAMLEFSSVVADPCTDGGSPLDTAVRATLQGTVSFTIEARRLTITGSGGHGLGLLAPA